MLHWIHGTHPSRALAAFSGRQQMSHLHYLPLAPRFFAILVGFFLIVLILRSVRYAYEKSRRQF